MVPWRGRFSFRQYVPGKAHEYEVKMYKVEDTNGYTWNFMIYTGKQNPTTSLGHSQAVTMQLLEDLFGCYRPVVADNFFTSITLAKRLLENDTQVEKSDSEILQFGRQVLQSERNLISIRQKIVVSEILHQIILYFLSRSHVIYFQYKFVVIS